MPRNHRHDATVPAPHYVSRSRDNWATPISGRRLAWGSILVFLPSVADQPRVSLDIEEPIRIALVWELRPPQRRAELAIPGRQHRLEGS